MGNFLKDRNNKGFAPLGILSFVRGANFDYSWFVSFLFSCCASRVPFCQSSVNVMHTGCET